MDHARAILNKLRDLTRTHHAANRHALLWRECEAIRHYLWSFQLDNAGTDYIKAYVNDALPRFLHTLDMLPFQAGLKVLELGANPYLFTLLMKKFYDFEIYMANFFNSNIYYEDITSGTQRIWSNMFGEDYSLEYMNFNIELSSYPYQDNTFDMILFCEILEHLIINPLQVFPKLRRIIRPGGLLILTTPNAVRLSNVAHLIEGSNFFDRYHPEFGVYGRHNREFTCEELQVLLQNNGFEMVHLVTLDRYNYSLDRIHKDNYERPAVFAHTKNSLEHLLRNIGANLNNRGDNIYAVARKLG